jgi:hypothetical protein
MTARPLRRSTSTKFATAELEAELADEQQCSAGHRADYERERDRADRMVPTG